MDLLGLLHLVTMLGLLAVLAAALVVLGFAVEPRPLDPHREPSGDHGVVALPDGLPAPVARHFGSLAGGPLPRCDTAALWGRMRMKILGLWMPLTFRSYYEAGSQFARRMTVCWWGLPVLDAVDSYLAGVGRLQVRSNVATGEPIDQGERLAMWGECMFLPSVFLTDERCRWESAGDLRARLRIGEDVFTLDFHPATGRLVTLSAMRYRAGTPEMVQWRADFGDWLTRHGVLLPSRVTVSWADQHGPYGIMRLDGLVYNVDVSSHLQPPPPPAE